MATGRPLLGVRPFEGPLTVWIINLEDPQEELERRVTAILLHYKIDPAEINGRLFLDSGRRLKLVVAEATKAGTVIARPLVDAFTAEIKARKVDVVVVDPFVKAHRGGATRCGSVGSRPERDVDRGSGEDRRGHEPTGLLPRRQRQIKHGARST